MDITGWLVVKDVLLLGWSTVTCCYTLTGNSANTLTDEVVHSQQSVFWHIDEAVKFKLLQPLGPFQMSNFSCAESNANEKKSIVFAHLH